MSVKSDPHLTPLRMPTRRAPPVRWRTDPWQNRHLAALGLVVALPMLLRALTPDLGLRDGFIGAVAMIAALVVGAIALVLYVAAVRVQLGAPDEARRDDGGTLRLPEEGIYAFTRNPQPLAVLLLVATQALWMDSWLLVGYAVVLAAAMQAYIVLRDEPVQRARLREAFDEYALRVPRWLPWRAIGDFLADMGRAIRQIVRR